MKSLITFVIVLICALSSYGVELKTGDLLFQLSGNSDFSKAISSSTHCGDSLDFAHVAIVCVEADSLVTVIEASPEEGVRKIDLEAFLSSAPRVGDMPGVVVKRLQTDFSPADVIENAKKHIGEEYDWWYMPDNAKMYCSELVYECYLDAEGMHIFEARPMNFRNSDGSMPDFWVRLYDSLGIAVPEGISGTNPNDLSKDAALVEIYRFF